MVIDVHKENKELTNESSIGGIEIGVAGFGIRGVAPIIDNGKLVGSFEFGFDHTHLIEQIAKTTNTSIAILLDKKMFKTTDDDSSSKIPLNKELLNKLFTEDPAFIRSDINGKGTLCSDKCSTLIKSIISNNKQWFKNNNNKEGKHFSIKNNSIYSHPLEDANKKSIGFVFIISEKKQGNL
jgi:hypothetical protein